MIVGSTEGETILSTNNKMPPLDNVKVRKAIAHAIDRQAIIDGAMFGYGTPIGTHFAPHHPDYRRSDRQLGIRPRNGQSSAGRGGLADGFTTTLKLPPPSYARRGGEIIAAQLRAVGIETEISNLEWAQWLEAGVPRQGLRLTIVSHTEPMDIGIYARPDYYFQYDNPRFSGVDDRAESTTDPATRKLDGKRTDDHFRDYVNGFLFELAVPAVANAKSRFGKMPPTQSHRSDSGLLGEDLHRRAGSQRVHGDPFIVSLDPRTPPPNLLMIHTSQADCPPYSSAWPSPRSLSFWWSRSRRAIRQPSCLGSMPKPIPWPRCGPSWASMCHDTSAYL